MAQRIQPTILVSIAIILASACGASSETDGTDPATEGTDTTAPDPTSDPAAIAGAGGDTAAPNDAPASDAMTTPASTGGTAGSPSFAMAPAVTFYAPFTGSCGGVMCATPPLGTPGCCTVAGTGVPGDPFGDTGRAPDLCGTDLGAFVPSITGVCLQLDQPGDPDEACPVVNNGYMDELGCCTDEGFCGTISASAGLGCHYPASGKGSPCGE